jgi:MFS transporter, FHS family, glucose/mannose:H+ symporter
MYKRNLVFLSSCLGMLIFGIVLITIGSVLPSITAKFNLNEISTGSLVSILPLGILAGSLIFGPIVDHYGYKPLLIVCSFLILIGLQGIAYASTFLILQISIFLIGFGGGVINGGTNALVADISTEGKSANLSLLGVFFGIGALAMPIILGLLSKVFTYQSIISVIGFFIIIPVLFFSSIKFPVPKQPQSLPIKQGLGLIKESTLILIGFVLFFQSGMEGIVNNWTTTYMQNVIKVKSEDALFALTFSVFGLTVTRLLLGTLFKKISSKTVLYTSLFITLIGCLLVMYGTILAISIIGLFFMGCGLAANFPLMLGYAGEIYSKITGTAFGVILVIALIGNMILNYLVGVISHSHGIQGLPIILIICLIIVALLITFVLKRINRQP